MDRETTCADREGTGMDAVARAERARRVGDVARAASMARAAIGGTDDTAARVALALTLLDRDEIEEARRALEALLETLLGEGAIDPDPGFASVVQPTGTDPTVAAAAAATLELVGSLDDEDFEQAMQQAEAQRELMLDADAVAQQAMREVSAELPDEILPSDGSPFATRTFADLLERQGHETAANSLRSAITRRGGEAPGGAPEADVARIVATLERWLENLRRKAV